MKTAKSHAKQKPTLLIVTSNYLPQIGGSEQYIAEVSRRLAAQWRVVLITAEHVHRHRGVSTVNDILVYSLPKLITISNTPLGFRWGKHIRRIIALEKPSVLWLHTPVPTMSDTAVHEAGSLPVVVTVHAGISPSDSAPIRLAKKMYTALFTRATLQRATAIISSSEFLAKTMLQPYAAKTSVIGSGVDTSRFHPNPLQPKQKNILLVTSLKKSERYKDVDTALAAFAILLTRYPSVRMRIVGDGDDRTRLMELASSLKLTHAVTFVGSRSGEALEKEVQQATIFYHPSIFESSPLVILEAMASGLPIVACNTAGIPALVENNRTGLLVPPKDSRAAANALEALLTNQQLQITMRRAARTKALKEYTWDHQAHAVNEVIRAAVREAKTQ